VRTTLGVKEKKNAVEGEGGGGLAPINSTAEVKALAEEVAKDFVFDMEDDVEEVEDSDNDKLNPR